MEDILIEKYEAPVKAKNDGLRWANIPIDKYHTKCVAVEIIDHEVGILRLWDSDPIDGKLLRWEESETRKGWFYKNVLPEEVTFIDPEF